MANEITVSAQLSLNNGTLIQQDSGTSIQVDQNTNLYAAGVWTVGTTEENGVFGDVTSKYYLKLLSLEPAGGSEVEFGPLVTGSMAPFLRLKPGEVAVMPLVPGITVRGKATNSPVKVQYIMLNA